MEMVVFSRNAQQAPRITYHLSRKEASVMKQSIGTNTLAMPTVTPVWVVGSYDSTGRPNMATVAWCGICCSKPPCVTVSLRAATYTHGNILERRAFTVNIPSAEQVRETDYAGISAYSGKKGNKFESLGLTPMRSQMVDAPYVAEFAAAMECQLLEVHELGLHTQFIGEVLDVKVDNELLDSGGRADFRKLAPFVFWGPTNEYLTIETALGQAFQMGKEADWLKA
jgi:flavin reductase (DIM6/NTAB) family NADH-FMN oxidoreductase RutF